MGMLDDYAAKLTGLMASDGGAAAASEPKPAGPSRPPMFVNSDGVAQSGQMPPRTASALTGPSISEVQQPGRAPIYVDGSGSAMQGNEAGRVPSKPMTNPVQSPFAGQSSPEAFEYRQAEAARSAAARPSVAPAASPGAPGPVTAAAEVGNAGRIAETARSVLGTLRGAGAALGMGGLFEAGLGATNAAASTAQLAPDLFANSGDPNMALPAAIIQAARDQPGQYHPQQHPLWEGLKRLAGDNPVTDLIKEMSRGSAPAAAASKPAGNVLTNPNGSQVQINPDGTSQLIKRPDNEPAAAQPELRPAPRLAPRQLDPEALAENQRRIYDQAMHQGVAPEVAHAIVSIESGFNPAAKNPNSSAAGFGQLLKKNLDQYNLTPEEKADPDVQAAVAVDHMKRSSADLERMIGRAPAPYESYMAHLFGPTGAYNILSADVNTPIKDVIRSYDPKNADDIVKFNKLSGMTVGQVGQRMDALMARHMPDFGNGAPGSGLEAGSSIQSYAAGVGAPAQGGARAGRRSGSRDLIEEVAQRHLQQQLSAMEAPRSFGWHSMVRKDGTPMALPGTPFVPPEIATLGADAVGRYLAARAQGAMNEALKAPGKITDELQKGQNQVDQQDAAAAGHLANTREQGRQSRLTAAQKAELDKSGVTNVPVQQTDANGKPLFDPVTGAPIYKEFPTRRNAEGELEFVRPKGTPPGQKGALPPGASPDAVRARAIAEVKANRSLRDSVNTMLSEYGIAALSDQDLK